MKKETKWYRDQIAAYQGITPPHLLSVTELTRFGNLDILDKRQKRYGKLKLEARATAHRNVPDGNGDLPFPKRVKGAWFSPVGFNSAKGKRNNTLAKDN